MADLDNARAFDAETLLDALQAQPPGTPLLIDFWEPRCTACRATLHVIDALACRVDEHGVVGTFNVREDPETARALGIDTVPTLVVFREGEVESVLQGAETIQTFVERIDEEVFFGAPPTCDQ